jgi:hypothetical protein
LMSGSEAKRAADCPCIQAECPIRGDCVACVRVHREHGQHLPECMQEMVRGLVSGLAGKVELRTSEGRPTPAFWAKRKAEEGEGEGV